MDGERGQGERKRNEVGKVVRKGDWGAKMTRGTESSGEGKEKMSRTGKEEEGKRGRK